MVKQGLTQLRTLKHVLCSFCDCRAILTDWRPPKGIDPAMREYRCKCGTICYKRMETYEEHSRPEWGKLFD